MSSLMLLSVKEKKDILKNLVSKRSKKFNKEYVKVLKIVEKNEFLKNYKEKLENLKDEFKIELNSINLHDIDWETHERKGAEIEKKFNKKLLNIKYEINKTFEIVSSYNFNNYKEKNFKPKNDLEITLKKIKSLNQKEYERIKNLEIDDKLKLKEAKVVYQRLVYSNLYKEEIDDILEDVPEYLSEKFKNLKQKEIIYKDEYEKLLDEYYNQENDEISVDKIVDAFEELGYKFEDVVLNEKGYIDTDDKEYKLAYRLENGKFSIAFTRFVDENMNINEYEKAKDKQKAKKWCSDFEKISKLLEKQGIELKKEMIKEPEDVEIRYEKVENREKLEQANQNMIK